MEGTVIKISFAEIQAEKKRLELPVIVEPVEAETFLYLVVLTTHKSKVDYRGMSSEDIRAHLIEQAESYCDYWRVNVVGGPWLDDNRTYTNPHVNMLIKDVARVRSEAGPFDRWNLERGYVDMKLIDKRGPTCWIKYASRNHKVCCDYRDGFIDFAEAQEGWKLKARDEPDMVII